MQYQKRRDLTLLEAKDIQESNYLDREITVDYIIVGGWVAGLHAAQQLLATGKTIALIDKSICGWGMSWRGWGFLTPDSEMWLRQIEDFYWSSLAQDIWDFWMKGQQWIVDNVHKLKLTVDLRQQDSLLLWRKSAWRTAVKKEHNDRLAIGLESEFFDAKELQYHISGKNYTAWLRYDGCYGINPLQYCQAMKSYLLQQWVQIFEHTSLKTIAHHHIVTSHGRINFTQAIFALGKVTEDIDPIKSQNTFGIHNFVTVSEPLTDKQISWLFPDGQEYMCRDTQMVFTYYRLIHDKRLILGWWTPISSFSPFESLSDYTITQVIKEMKENFPLLQSIDFPYYRSGKIEATKDLMPIIDRDIQFDNHVWIQWAVGLPRAASSGRYAVDLLLRNSSQKDNSLHQVFAADREFLLSWQTNITFFKSIIFALCNGKTMWIL